MHAPDDGRRVRHSVALLIALALAWPATGAQGPTEIQHTRHVVHLQYELDVEGAFDASNDTRVRFTGTHQSLKIHGTWETTFLLTPTEIGYSGGPLGGSREGKLKFSSLDENIVYNETRGIVTSDTQTRECDETLGVRETFPAAGGFTIEDGVVHADLIVSGVFMGKGPCKIKTTSISRSAPARFNDHESGLVALTLGHAGLPAGPIDAQGRNNAWDKIGEPSFHGIAALRFAAPLDATTRFNTGAVATFVPDGPATAGRAEQVYCGELYPFAQRPDERGSCEWKGELSVYIKPDPCEGIQELYDARVAELKALGPVPPPGPDRGFRLANFGQTAGYFISNVNAVVRHAQLWGCDLVEDGYVQQLVADLRSAWESYWRTTSDKHYLDDWLDVEHTAEAMGLPASQSGPSGTRLAGGGASQSVGVHSPAEIEAFSPDGGRVGWDAATTNSSSSIPGATYQGHPGAPQTITLPAGVYRVVVHELADSAIVITDEWAAPGVEGDDTAPASATDGRTTSYYVSLTKGSNGNWTRSVSPVVRQTTASFTPGFARPLATAPPPDVPTPHDVSGPSDGPVDGGDDTGVSIPSELADLFGDDGLGGNAKPVPALGATGPVLALAVALIGRRTVDTTRR